MHFSLTLLKSYFLIPLNLAACDFSQYYWYFFHCSLLILLSLC